MNVRIATKKLASVPVLVLCLGMALWGGFVLLLGIHLIARGGAWHLAGSGLGLVGGALLLALRNTFGLYLFLLITTVMMLWIVIEVGTSAFGSAIAAINTTLFPS